MLWRVAVVLFALFQAPMALATQTGTWTIGSGTGSSATGGNVTTVTATTGQYWTVDGNTTLTQPVNGTYTPYMSGASAVLLTYDPGNTSRTRNVTFTFSNPVTDPVLHIDRLGGSSGGYNNSSAWTLVSGNGATSLTRLSGVGHFLVDQGGQRFRASVNDSVGGGWSSTCSSSAYNGAACGSVRINGTFTTLTFSVRMEGSAGAGDQVGVAFTFNQDLGDAPSSYGRALHAISAANDRYLGNQAPDDDASGNEYSSASDSDDNNGVDDEDALSLSPLPRGQSTPVTLTVHEPTVGSSYLSAWVDWNQNGQFDSGERVANNIVNNGSGDSDSDSGTITFNMTAPANAATGSTNMRLRWSSQNNLGAGTAARDGEVEDHSITVASGVLITCPDGSSSTGGGIASAGNGPYREAVYWLDWNCGSTNVFNAGDSIKKTWNFGPVTIRATLVMNGSSASVYPYDTGDWSGDLLDDLYQGVNPIGLMVDGGTANYTISWQVFRYGVQIPADVIVADAEDTDGGEYLQFGTDGAAWEVFARSPANPDLVATFSGGGTSLRLDTGNQSPDIGTMLAMSQGVTQTSHTYLGSGKQAEAFGVFVQTDYGDLPAGYPESGGHSIRKIATGGSKPTSATNVGSLSLAQLAVHTPYLGNVAPDPESGDLHSAAADGDDGSGDDDEDGVAFSTFRPGQQADVTLQVQDDSLGHGYLQGWIDWNNDQDFDDPGEQVAYNVRDNGEQDRDATAGRVVLRVFVPPYVPVGQVYARFRFSNQADVNAGSDRVIGGEQEDYRIPVSPPQYTGLEGAVFADDGAGGATAHDGVRGGTEAGLADVYVRLLEDTDNDGLCEADAAVWAQTRSNGSGDWHLDIPAAHVGQHACLVSDLAPGYRAVSENNGSQSLVMGSAEDSTMGLVIPPASSYWSGLLFGQVPSPMLEPPGQNSIEPGGTRFYAHLFTAGTLGTVDFALGSASGQPAALNWGTVLYRDANCNGEVDGLDAQLPLTGVAVSAGDQLCLLAKVFAPADAPVDAVLNLPVQAVQSLTGTTLQDTASVTDLTRVVITQLALVKKVRNIGPDGLAGTADDVDASARDSNSARPNDVLRYSLLYSNQGHSALTAVDVYDSTPPYTSLASPASCPASLPAGLTACTLNAPQGSNSDGYQGSLHWHFEGQLPAGASGSLFYDVRVSP
ncbi:hypothetical protein A11A3_00540 [Alcanivorax hongdengensis A-11-3]|uniref:Uncharacterized protein n=1 Tax=Alcanivorax hongdengensis A-11-3 TaxID=1177179 RepID=L0WG12_9GAMM|nr:hypothetical protein A11A3_00540 [Alcanivorax hongdengensis A-11-3]